MFFDVTSNLIVMALWVIFGLVKVWAFIGYDSACQHIGAALNVRTFTVFAGTNNARFIRRWHACGPNTSEILYVDTLSREHQIDTLELIERLQDLRR